MKNKSFKYPSKFIIFLSNFFIGIFALTGIQFFFAPEILAWSTYTHAAISAEALSKYSSLIPEAVYSSSLPDITTNFISPASKDKFYTIFHGDVFYESVLSLLPGLDKKRDRTMICNIYGFISHITADKAAHLPSSYANSKTTFSVKTELNHYTAYLFMDMLCYYDYFYGYNSKFGKFVPSVDFKLVKASLDAFNSRNPAGGEAQLIMNEFIKKEAAFKIGIAVEKAIFDIIIEDNPELFEQIRSFYFDYYSGVNGNGGFLDAVTAVEEKIAGGHTAAGTNGLKTFIDRRLEDLTYAGMQFISQAASDSEFIRTSKITSGRLESFISKFFESKSASTKAMGKFLSALLLKKGLTFEEIIDYTDGVNISTRKTGNKFIKYKSSYKKLKEPCWHSFIPGSRRAEKREYIEAFIDYKKEKTECEIKEYALSPEEAQIFREAENERLDAYRNAYLHTGLNPADYVEKKALSDAAFAHSGIIKSIIITKNKNKNINTNDFLKKFEIKINAINNKNLKAQKNTTERSFAYKIFNPLKTIYEKQYAAAAASNNIKLKNIFTRLNAPASSQNQSFNASCENTIPVPAFYKTSAEIEITRIPSFNGDENNTAINDALAAMQSAYKDYTEALNSHNIKEFETISAEGEKIRRELDSRLQKYLRYKSIYETLRGAPSAGNNK